MPYANAYFSLYRDTIITNMKYGKRPDKNLVFFSIRLYCPTSLYPLQLEGNMCMYCTCIDNTIQSRASIYLHLSIVGLELGKGADKRYNKNTSNK